MVAPWQTHSDADPKYPTGIRSHVPHRTLIPILGNAGSMTGLQPIMVFDRSHGKPILEESHDINPNHSNGIQTLIPTLGNAGPRTPSAPPVPPRPIPRTAVTPGMPEPPLAPTPER
ncbi:hypothetical protein DUI87_32027 [Hirundo rustica rustica]|uniref:Uncharacterized protein n=1 Tax=Hirundo rustica rustica TaxID=333673 RepID=A0A3M0ISE8_HIRRU|nr:hypothetical protein DUI87_32027 [Hirundo rustica rustica]